MSDEVLDQRVARLDKLKKMEEMGINAYPHIYTPTETAESLKPGS